MLQATNITYRVGNKPLITDISASFTPGKLHLIIGPNGAGKSTLIKVLARHLRPQVGKVEYEGADVSETVGGSTVYINQTLSALSTYVDPTGLLVGAADPPTVAAGSAAALAWPNDPQSP